MWVCVRVHRGGLFFREQLRNNSSSTNNAQRSRTIGPLTAFVCGAGERGNEIMLRALAGCEQSLSKSKARPRGEYQSLISQPRCTYGNEEQFIQCIVSKQRGMCFSPSRAISPLLQSLPIFSLLHSLNVTMYYCETVHAKVMTNHLSQ